MYLPTYQSALSATFTPPINQGSPTEPTVPSLYYQADGTSLYYQPDGISLYTQPEG